MTAPREAAMPHPSAGHRLLPHAADCTIEAWGPDRASCLTQALEGLVESFAQVADAPVTQSLPLAALPSGAQDEVVILFEDVLCALDVFGVVPVQFHLSEAEDGGVAGEMDVVPVAGARLVGPVPKGVSYHALSMEKGRGGWRCRVLVDV